MISMTAGQLRNVCLLLESLDEISAKTGMTFVGRVNFPAERYSVMAHEFEVPITFHEAGKCHTIEIEG